MSTPGKNMSERKPTLSQGLFDHMNRLVELIAEEAKRAYLEGQESKYPEITAAIDAELTRRAEARKP
jgi:hypothetical protein